MPDRPHHQRADTWSSAARDYEDLFVPFSDRVAGEALARIRLREGERFLDVAAGTGAVSLRAARAGAEVTAIDFAEEMLALLRRKAAAAAIDGIATHVMDGHALAFEDDAFDAAGSNLGLVFFREADQGLRELRRVVRPGGRVFVTSVSATSPSRVMQLAGAAIRATDNAAPAAAGPAYGLTDTSSMAAALLDAGFARVQAEDVALTFPVVDLVAFWDKWILGSPPTFEAMQALTREHREAARTHFLLEARAEQPSVVAHFEAHAIIGVGRA